MLLNFSQFWNSPSNFLFHKNVWHAIRRLRAQTTHNMILSGCDIIEIEIIEYFSKSNSKSNRDKSNIKLCQICFIQKIKLPHFSYCFAAKWDLTLYMNITNPIVLINKESFTLMATFWQSVCTDKLDSSYLQSLWEWNIAILCWINTLVSDEFGKEKHLDSSFTQNPMAMKSRL